MIVSERPSTAALLDSCAHKSVARSQLLFRIAGLLALFILELIVLSVWLDTRVLDGRGGFIGSIGDFGPHLLRSSIAFTTVFLAFGFVKARKGLLSISDHLADVPIRWTFLAAHVAGMSAFAFLSKLLFSSTKGAFSNLIASLWITTGLLGIATALFFFIPSQPFLKILRETGSAWAWAAGAACATPVFVAVSGRLWKPATALTFKLVTVFLRPFVSPVADPVTWTLGSPKFSVQIEPACSGMEGMGLMLIFGVLWLGFFYRDYRFPRALLLIPVGMALMFLLNSMRITALILIGNAGATNVALGGFHSQAGWIAFNGLALGWACLAHRVPWISARGISSVSQDRVVEDPTAAYLVPFLAILGASMLSGATSGGFEWMYPLRFAAAAGALLLFRGEYSKINWKFGWPALGIGALVFLLWIGLDRLAGIPQGSRIAAGLAASPTAARITWVVFRVLAAVVTVPIAEELAFRGFLLRRLISAEFDSVSLQRWTFLAVAGSSIAFGLLHGNRWIAGTIAGVLFAVAQKSRGRLGDAVVAHGVTNALIALWVLWGGHWSLW